MWDMSYLLVSKDVVAGVVDGELESKPPLAEAEKKTLQF